MIQLPVTFDSANRKKDRSLTLRQTTTFEISNEDFAEIDKYMGQTGWMLFKPNSSFTDDEVPQEDAPVEEGKSKGQRLRAAYFLIWKNHTEQDEPFDFWYARQFEKLLDKVKERID